MDGIGIDLPATHDRHNKILTITGISGCGKDYLLNRCKQEVSMSSLIRIVNFGQELYEYLCQLHPQVKSRDDVKRMLSQAQVAHGIEKLMGSIIHNQPAVLNTHVVYWQNGILTSNPDIDTQLNARQYVFIWADPAQIFAWRLQDSSRSRPQESIEEIALHQKEAFELVSAIAMQVGSGITTMLNRSGNVEDNISILSRLMATLVS